jgi:Flp pilus assembly protein TadG
MSRIHSRSGGISTKRSAPRRSGAAVLEMALTLSLLFWITYGMIEFGFFYFTKNSMEGAAREGCRAGIVAGGTSSTSNIAIINQLSAAGLVSSSVTASGSAGTYTIGNFTVVYSDIPSGSSTSTIKDISSMAVGDTVTVTISATWGTVGQGFRPAALISATKTMTMAAAMRKEG